MQSTCRDSLDIESTGDCWFTLIIEAWTVYAYWLGYVITVYSTFRCAATTRRRSAGDDQAWLQLQKENLWMPSCCAMHLEMRWKIHRARAKRISD